MYALIENHKVIGVFEERPDQYSELGQSIVNIAEEHATLNQIKAIVSNFGERPSRELLEHIIITLQRL